MTIEHSTARAVALMNSAPHQDIKSAFYAVISTCEPDREAELKDIFDNWDGDRFLLVVTPSFAENLQTAVTLLED